MGKKAMVNSRMYHASYLVNKMHISLSPISKGGSDVVGLGKVGRVLGKFGSVVCKRWRASRLKLMLEKTKASRRVVMKKLLEAMT
ncbi:unnamed protein product [Lupinus luteus]|uniref:Uncharacterized protein n=1 Tax=Lupinus luteus TaxID=3873 RepID=A0AAV1WRU8_LUPLU